ncbi:kielin/chordin-like protein [Branchiostoma floridae x Branchiostoma japonicum]
MDKSHTVQTRYLHQRGLCHIKTCFSLKQVNDVTRTLPFFLAGGQIDVRLTGRFVRVELVDLCVVILYDGLHQVDVEIPRNYQYRLCGLCGNFNGDNIDDYRLPNGSITTDLNTFGNSWQTNDPYVAWIQTICA